MKDYYKSDNEFCSEQTPAFYVHGKDSILFHPLIWPGKKVFTYILPRKIKGILGYLWNLCIKN